MNLIKIIKIVINTPVIVDEFGVFIALAFGSAIGTGMTRLGTPAVVQSARIELTTLSIG